MIRCLTALSVTALCLTLNPSSQAFATGAANDNTVLILGTTAHGGTASEPAQIVRSMGYDVEIASNADWAAKSTEDFASYRGIILADPECVQGTTPIAAAEANTSVWGPAVDGNLLIVGTDADFHNEAQPGGEQLMRSGLAYVLSAPRTAGKTGAYISLSCYYNESGPSNTVQVLRYFGNFVVGDNPTCHDDIHITTPTNGAMAGLTDALLSNWDCSIHELFKVYPSNYTVLAIADNLGSVYTDDDGSVGTPYILARGAVDCPVLPTLTINSITPSSLFPPNKKMIDIYANVTVTGTMVNVTRTVTSSEVPSGPEAPIFENGTDVYNFKLRAARNGNNKEGRTYTITFTGTDACGNMTSSSTTVVVPHDQGKSNK